MKILVTGALGTIGRPLCRALEENGHRVVGVDMAHAPMPRSKYIRADVSDFREFSAAVAEFQRDKEPIELCYHLAAEFGRINGAEHYERLWRSNCIGLRTVLNVLGGKRGRKPRLVHASTSEVYGDRNTGASGPLPLEETIADDFPRPMNDYAISKYANELQLRSIETKRCGVQWTGVRLFNVYGPGEVGNARRSVIAQFVLSMLRGDRVVAYAETWRDALFIDDAIAALGRFALPWKPWLAKRFMNLSGGQYESIRQVAALVAAIVSEEAGIRYSTIIKLIDWRTTEPGNSPHKMPGRERPANRILKWRPQVSLEDGVRATVRWAIAETQRGGLRPDW